LRADCREWSGVALQNANQSSADGVWPKTAPASVRQVEKLAPTLRIDIARHRLAGLRRPKQRADRTTQPVLWAGLVIGLLLRRLTCADAGSVPRTIAAPIA